MPTENRSSNTEQMVSVPVSKLKKIHRDLDACQKVIWLRGGFDPAYCKDAQDSLKDIDALLAQPAAQHQGEPVAYQWRCKTVNVDSQWRQWVGCTEEDYSATIANPGPTSRGIIREARKLYTHADAGEVERPSQIALSLQTKLKSVESERDRLRAKLAEHEHSARELLRIIGMSVQDSAAYNRAVIAFHDSLNADTKPN